MADDLHVQAGLTIPAWELTYSTSRASGAGGQHVNTTDSRVTLCWYPARCSVLDERQKARVTRALRSRLTSDGALQISAQDERSQHRNRDIARERLAALLMEALKVRKRRKKTRPSRGAVERRLTAKRVSSEKKKLRKKPTHDD